MIVLVRPSPEFEVVAEVIPDFDEPSASSVAASRHQVRGQVHAAARLVPS